MFLVCVGELLLCEVVGMGPRRWRGCTMCLRFKNLLFTPFPQTPNIRLHVMLAGAEAVVWHNYPSRGDERL